MKKLFTLAAVMLAGALMAGCTDGPLGDYSGSERGVDIQIDTVLGAEVRGRSTTYKKDTELPLGTLTVTPDGGLDMTGPGVETWARMSFCKSAPNAAECNGGAWPDPLLSDASPFEAE